MNLADDKEITLAFKAVGNAPILKEKSHKFQISRKDSPRFIEIHQFLGNLLWPHKPSRSSNSSSDSIQLRPHLVIIFIHHMISSMVFSIYTLMILFILQKMSLYQTWCPVTERMAIFSTLRTV